MNESRPILMKPSEIRSLQQAAHDASVSIDTMRRLCRKHSIARQRGAHGRLEVSAIALQMVLHDDMEALEALRDGKRGDPIVRAYFDFLGLPV